jgi:hypothetical protein
VKAVNIFCGFGNLGIFWQLTRRRHRVMNLMIETEKENGIMARQGWRLTGNM